MTVTPLMEYRFGFFAGDRQVGAVDLVAVEALGPEPDGDSLLEYLHRALGLRPFAIDLPQDLPAFDRIDIDCKHLDILVAAIGSIELRR
ncbi:MAG: hypothetical protein ABIP94_19075 [Planctomycetota bacterium]